jgi:hypothetical protein
MSTRHQDTDESTRNDGKRSRDYGTYYYQVMDRMDPEQWDAYRSGELSSDDLLDQLGLAGGADQ